MMGTRTTGTPTTMRMKVVMIGSISSADRRGMMRSFEQALKTPTPSSGERGTRPLQTGQGER
jgi:hypothetical protein